jgi:hypothetical protein
VEKVAKILTYEELQEYANHLEDIIRKNENTGVCYYCFTELAAEEPPEVITLVKLEKKPKVAADR